MNGFFVSERIPFPLESRDAIPDIFAQSGLKASLFVRGPKLIEKSQFYQYAIFHMLHSAVAFNSALEMSCNQGTLRFSIDFEAQKTVTGCMHVSTVQLFDFSPPFSYVFPLQRLCSHAQLRW